MRTPRFSRRKFLGLCSVPLGIAAEAAFWEPTWIKIREIQLSATNRSRRVVHITDLHHKGDLRYLLRVVEKVNTCKPDLVCFTGDLVEEVAHLPPVLEAFQQISAPVYGVPGNHDYWADVDFDMVAAAFARTGGRWLMDEQVTTPDGRFHITGATCQGTQALKPESEGINILLFHIPGWARHLPAGKWDLLLSGHTHGGQVRVPLYGALILPFDSGDYQVGMYATQWGPMYVGPGLGTFFLKARLLCRPEITVFQL